MKAEVKTVQEQVVIIKDVDVVTVEMSVEDARALKDFLGALSRTRVVELVPRRNTDHDRMYDVTYVMYCALHKAMVV